MKSTIYRKWRLSKYKFRTRVIAGDKPGDGSLDIGRVRAATFLARTLGSERVDKMTVHLTKGEWVFKERIPA